MPNLNMVQIMGHLGQDPETRHGQSGNAVVNMSVAATERWTGKDGQKQEHTEWVRAVAFGPRGEAMAQYLSKGDPVYIQGKLRTRKWQDQSGQDRWSTEVIVDRFEFLRSKKDAQPQAQPRPTPAPLRAVPDDSPLDEDIPF